MLKYYMTIIAYTQQLLDMEDLFGTSANCTVDIAGGAKIPYFVHK